MTGSLVITLRLKKTTTHTNTNTHTHTHTHEHNDVKINNKKRCNSARKTQENCLKIIL